MTTDPYEAVRALGTKLEEEGVDTDQVIDAMLVTGLNAAAKAAGPEFVCEYLRKMLVVFEAKAEKQDPPPTTH